MSRQIRAGRKDADAMRQHWRTPHALARAIVETFGVVVDVAASKRNAVVPRYMCSLADDIESCRDAVHIDALTCRDWGEYGAVCFGNFPFSSLMAFVDVALRSSCTTVVLAPISTDTQWFRRLVEAGTEVLALSGRVPYLPPRELCRCGVDSDDAKAHHMLTEMQTMQDDDGLFSRLEMTFPCPYRAAAQHGPAFPSALYVLRPDRSPRPVGAPIPFRLVEQSTLRPL